MGCANSKTKAEYHPDEQVASNRPTDASSYGNPPDPNHQPDNDYIPREPDLALGYRPTTVGRSPTSASINTNIKSSALLSPRTLLPLTGGDLSLSNTTTTTTNERGSNNTRKPSAPPTVAASQHLDPSALAAPYNDYYTNKEEKKKGASRLSTASSTNKRGPRGGGGGGKPDDEEIGEDIITHPSSSLTKTKATRSGALNTTHASIYSAVSGSQRDALAAATPQNSLDEDYGHGRLVVGAGMSSSNHNNVGSVGKNGKRRSSFSAISSSDAHTNPTATKVGGHTRKPSSGSGNGSKSTAAKGSNNNKKSNNNNVQITDSPDPYSAASTTRRPKSSIHQDNNQSLISNEYDRHHDASRFLSFNDEVSPNNAKKGVAAVVGSAQNNHPFSQSSDPRNQQHFAEASRGSRATPMHSTSSTVGVVGGGAGRGSRQREGSTNTLHNLTSNDNEDLRSFVDDLDGVEMESAVEGDDIGDPNDLTTDYPTDPANSGGDLAQTVTIYHAGIEIDVITAMLRDGGEIIHHRPRVAGPSSSGGGGFHHVRTRSALSARGGEDDRLRTAHSSDFDEEEQENEEWEEEFEEDEEWEEAEETYTETLSMASNNSEGDEHVGVVATASTIFHDTPVQTPLRAESSHFDHNNVHNIKRDAFGESHKNTNTISSSPSLHAVNSVAFQGGDLAVVGEGPQATFRIVKRNRAPSMVSSINNATPETLLAAGGGGGKGGLPAGLPPTSPQRGSGKGLLKSQHHQQQHHGSHLTGSSSSPFTGSTSNAQFRDIEATSEPNSAAGQIISQRLSQQGNFDLSLLRPGVDLLAKTPKLTPKLVTYNPAADPRLAGEYEAIAQRIAKEDPLLLSSIGGPSSFSSSVAAGAMLVSSHFGNLNVSMNATMFAANMNSTSSKDYGKGRSAALPPMDISSSWDLLKSIPNAVEILNSGGILFRYQAKKWSEMTLSERIEMGSFVNLSQFTDEEEQNDQPIIDFVNNNFTSPENDLTDMTVICARLMTLVPRITSKDLNVDVVCSDDYQKVSLASDEVLEKADRPRTIRKNKTVVRFVFSFRVQMSGSERADDDELSRHVHHHDCKPNRLLIMERTRKHRGGRDGTLKSKAVTLLYDIPPAGWVKGHPPQASGSGAAVVGGGVLQSLTNITIKSSIPSAMLMLMDKIGASIGSDCIKNTPTERVYLVKRKEEAWKLMAAGGDFPDLKLPWPVQ